MRWRALWVLLLLALAGAPLLIPDHADAVSGRLCERRGVCHKVAQACSQQVQTHVLNTGTASFTIPTGVTLLEKVAAIGAGAGAANGNNDAGGGGGAYSEVDNVAVTPGNALALSIGTHGSGGAQSTGSTAGTAGGDTSVSYLGTQIVLAKGGQPGGGFVGGAGGAASGGVGTVKTSGGAGGPGESGGTGGGGAGGPHGDGGPGIGGASLADGPPYPGGAGGAGDAGFGGAGGAPGNGSAGSNGAPGGNGTEFGTAGSGGGGGGGNGGSGTQSPPGASGSYGAGGGAPGFGGPTQLAGADGADGVVVVQFTFCSGTPTPPPPPQQSFFVATTGNDSSAGTVSAPFLTLGRCQSAMRSSPTIKTCTLRAGTYNLATTFQLTAADNGETWQYSSADGVDTPIIDFGNAVSVGIQLLGVSNLTINGLTVQRWTGFGITKNGGPSYGVASADNDIVENCEVRNDTINGASNGFPAGISTDGSGLHFTVSHNYVHNVAAHGIDIHYDFNDGNNATTSIDGTVVDSNVVLFSGQLVQDSGGIYLDNHSGLTNSHVTITNNFIRDYGVVGGIHTNGIYLDDNANNVFIGGNIVGPPVSGSRQDNDGTFVHGGSDVTSEDNIFDLGVTADNFAGGNFNDNITLHGTANVIFRQNIIVSNFAGTQDTGTGPAVDATWLEFNLPTEPTINANLYHNYGGGQENTNGSNNTGDSNPVHANPLCSGYLYTLPGNSPAFSAPVSFIDPTAARQAGPPGFVIPTSTNHSCP